MAFITVDEYRIITAGQVGESTAAERLERLLTASAKFIKRRTGYTWLQQSFDQYFNGDGKKVLRGLEIPINSITTFTIDDVSVDSNSYEYTSLEGKIEFITSCFTKGVQNIHLVYNAGYTIANIPADIKYLQAKIIMLMNAKMGKENLISQGYNESQLSFIQLALPADVQMILEDNKMTLA